jgi:hypothetical protein
VSGDIACACEERKKPVAERAWEYVNYKCNYSKFNGSRYTPSDYSLVHCKACGACWRTKAEWPIAFSQHD